MSEKKAKIHLEQVEESVLNPDLSSRISSFKSSFEHSVPYKHVAIPSLCTRQAAIKMHEEIQTLQGTLKETDLFRVYQTGDLANADDTDPVHAEKLKYLLALRRELNSDKFRRMIEEITNCGPLSTQVDLSANVYSKGCHLLCHDDVIASRRISYIVYLSDPDEEWLDEDGGRLELYPADPNTGLPQAEPTVRLLPTFNTLAMFVVEPGVSYHSVEEVFAENKPRVSLQGWFHASSPPEGFEKATLQQILNPLANSLNLEKVDVSTDVVNREPKSLSSQDIEELSKWVNPAYLKENALQQIREKCASEDNCVSLIKFIRNDLIGQIKKAMSESEIKSINLENWNTIGPAHLRRYLQLSNKSILEHTSMEYLLKDLQLKMSSPAFTRFLHLCVGDLNLVTRFGQIRRFRKGSDYTVAHSHQDSSVVDATLCFVVDDTEETSDLWKSGDVGGFEVYLNKEEDGKGDVAVYARDQESEGVVSIDAAFGTLCLVYRDESRMRFIKYISKSAPSDRYDISFSYVVSEDEEDDKEEEVDDE